MSPKVKPPFSEDDKKSIFAFCKEVFTSGRKIDITYSDFSEDEALALILPGTGFDIEQAQFILARARGELPDSEIGADGTNTNILY